MEIVLEVPDKDAARVLELIKGIKRVKVKSPVSARAAGKAQVLAELAEAVEDVKRYKRGEIELKSWDALYAELQAEQAAAEPASLTQPPALPTVASRKQPKRKAA